MAGVCSVTEIPADRWSLERHGHSRPREPGKSYVWAAGVVGDIWAFDPGVFGISPREAEQMDPQQRLMLELTWEALEDAGIRRSDLAGSEVGVFVGASSTEYQTVRNSDMASFDAYTATGSALSIISNRISHAFDFRGPSFTADTACSSSLVALHQAVEAIQSGRIDTAIVGGVNLLMSPYGFVMFAQASMLSPGGLCRTFDAKADGYVRSEGGVVLLLQAGERAARGDGRVYGHIAASGINSDGRTNGIALPSGESQAKLLQDIYGRGGIDPARVAFIEAHGTGTRVGDPIEASTIGETIGRERSRPLPIGSVKSNLGHLEPASGLAGVLKALLALEHDVLPPTLHFDEPNPDIAFDRLNLAVVTEPLRLHRTGATPRFAGINSFGFGGTNAHVVVADAPRPAALPRRPLANTDLFAISAASAPALRELARRYAEQLASATFEETREVVAAAAHRREMLSERAVVQWTSPRDLVRKLEGIADRDGDGSGITWGTASEPNAPVAFVFSGNGSQWPGMGRGAYATSRRFREAFDEVDALFDSEYGWSISEALLASDIEQRLRFTHVAQPLIFAVEVAVARTLAAEGLQPSFVIGHSVGEIATAVVAGALTLRDGVRVIQARSSHQEAVRDGGRMAVLAASRDIVEELCAEVGGVEVAAENSPRNLTVAGTAAAIAELGRLARRRRVVFRQLDLDYPFHCGLIDPVREPLLADLAGLQTAEPKVAMVSTVTGDLVSGGLDGSYWWRNVREPVRFSAALERAAALGARIFVEIGPRNVLLSNISDTLEAAAVPFSALGVLDRHEEPLATDPIRSAVLSAFTRGAAVELDTLFGPEPSRPVRLPLYPWNRQPIRAAETVESTGAALGTSWHRLAGARNSIDGIEWSSTLDLLCAPELADHEVGGQAIMPAAGFIEMASAFGRSWFGHDRVAILDLDISQPMVLERERSREVRLRLSPAALTLEILSRQRMSRAAWTLHAVARLTESSDDTVPDTLPAEPGQPIDAASVYRAAEAVGLRYGPAFRRLGGVRQVDARTLVADIVPAKPAAEYGLDPAALDACFQALFGLLDGLGASERGTAYIPVRFGHTRLLRPGAHPASARIDLLKAGEGSIVADFTLFDASGEPVAQLLDGRFQAARVRRRVLLADRALVAEHVVADAATGGTEGLPVTAAAILAAAGGTQDVDLSPGQMLLEGVAAALAFERARALSDGDRLSARQVNGLGPAPAAWLRHALAALGEMGLAEPEHGGWRLADAGALPSSAAILRTLADDHPDRPSELVLASRVSGGGALTAPSAALVDAFDLGSAAACASADRILDLLGRSGALAQDGAGGRRILQVGFGPLSHGLARLAAERGARVSVFEPEARRTERARHALRGHATTVIDTLEGVAPASFDLVVSSGALHRTLRSAGDLAAIRAAMAPGAGFVAIEPVPSLFADLALGLGDGWFGAGREAGPVGPLRAGESWAEELSAAGFEFAEARALAIGGDAASLLVAGRADATGPAPSLRRSIHITRPGQGRRPGLAERLDAALAIDGHDVRLWGRDEAAGRDVAAGDTVLFVARPQGRKGDVAELRDLSLALVAAAENCAGRKAELWVVAEARQGRSALADPVCAGLMALARTLANETNGLTVRRISIAPGLEPESGLATLRRLIAQRLAETDLLIDADGVSVERIVPWAEAAPSAGQPEGGGAARLERGQAGGLAGLGWKPTPPPAPADGEVEIEVAATGLNFRDVMWAMSLLPDDILEDGYAGPSLGLECSGTVTRVGSGVTRFAIGDPVLAFSPRAFSTRVAVPADVVSPLPAGWTLEAAAGVPVAFLTAWYGLVTLGGMKRGDWVLVHGAAGGVGLAAVQIARRAGATVVATAGTPDKQALLHALGVEHVLNSRSTSFVDDLRRIRRKGVDIVLNSLSGEAMERGLSTLAPFGRFVELGKRDYVANTKIGLRPFRRNLSYFGVDVDQLLADGPRAAEIFREITALFEGGELKPLPYRVFSADETGDAFRLMQQSGHVGKIVVRPPVRLPAAPEPAAFRVDPDRTHLVTGGFGGFGLEAARWLVDRGARHLVLAGRSGPQSEAARARLAEFEGEGVTVRAAVCDVADRRALARLLDDVAASGRPLAGVLHAAMVLDDALAANVTPYQMTRVLAPKVAGAAHLDALTAGQPLDYFVLFSSITTLIGNPGQGAYVAANGYLEGLARLRRERGEPGLALCWGAISDVGILARQKDLAEALSKRSGVRAMPAREALDLMAQAVAETGTHPDRAVVAIGSLDWSAARRLPLLASPSFAALLRDGSVVETAERRTIDLSALVASEPEDKVRRRVAEVVVEEIATVLRVPKQDVPAGKRLAEMGLDSLMAIELASAVQTRFGLDAPPSGSVGALTALGLADQLIGLAASGYPSEEARASLAVLDRHAGLDLGEAGLAPVMEAVVARSRDLKGLKA